MQVATTTDLIHYQYNDSVWLPVRPDSFDSTLVEAGPMPLRLSNSHYLFLYNSARCCVDSQKPGWDLQYNIGWCILSSSDPTVILQRSDSPLISPTHSWETGETQQQQKLHTRIKTAQPLHLTPNVVFVEGWQRYPDTLSLDHFLLYLGGADSVIGVVELKVHITLEEGYQQKFNYSFELNKIV